MRYPWRLCDGRCCILVLSGREIVGADGVEHTPRHAVTLRGRSPNTTGTPAATAGVMQPTLRHAKPAPVLQPVAMSGHKYAPCRVVDRSAGALTAGERGRPVGVFCSRCDSLRLAPWRRRSPPQSGIALSPFAPRCRGNGVLLAVCLCQGPGRRTRQAQ